VRPCRSSSLVAAAVLAATLCAAGEPIQGAFGVRLGAPFATTGAEPVPPTDNVYPFTPTEPAASLQFYFVELSSAGDRVARIWGQGFMSGKEACERELERLLAPLQGRHAPAARQRDGEGTQAHLETGGRYVELACYHGAAASTLVVRCGDRALLGETESPR